MIRITGPLLVHLQASLRTQIGEELWLGDERRHRYLVRVTGINRHELTGQILEERAGPPPHSAALTLGQALLKGDRMDWVVQKATELGVAGIVPLLTRRVITRPRPERVGPQQARWQRIALEAAQQAERWDVPHIERPQDARHFFSSRATDAVALILTERETGRESLTSISLPAGPESRILLAVGPEGGWEKEELSEALRHGFIPVTLGPRILRAETAALAALSVLQSRLGELG